MKHINGDIADVPNHLKLIWGEFTFDFSTSEENAAFTVNGQSRKLGSFYGPGHGPRKLKLDKNKMMADLAARASVMYEEKKEVVFWRVAAWPRLKSKTRRGRSNCMPWRRHARRVKLRCRRRREGWRSLDRPISVGEAARLGYYFFAL